jgi:hypothetical protein
MSKLHVLVHFLTTSPHFLAEELSSQLAEFAFFEDADGDDAPHTRTRSFSERQERDVRCLAHCLLLLSLQQFTHHDPELPRLL